LPDAAVDRIAAADAAAALERVAGADLAARGAVNIISVEAVRAVSGPRWERSRSGVWAFVEKRLDEHLSPHDLWHRLNDTDFLIALTDDSGPAAQGLSLRVLEEVLTHFLGQADPAHMQLKSVTGIGAGGIEFRPLAPNELARAARTREAPPPPPRPAPDEIDPAEEQRRNPASFLTAAGRRLTITFGVERLISLRHAATAALRIAPQVCDASDGRPLPESALAGLPDTDIARVDQATIDYGALYLPRPQARGGAPLILPVSYRTMMAGKGRAMLVQAAGAAPESARTSLLVELADVDRGTPPGRLVEVSSLLGSMTRGVLARALPGRDALAPLLGARLAGITVRASDLSDEPARLAAQLLDFGRQAKGAAPLLAVLGLESSDYFAFAEVGGLTHASVRAVAPAPVRTAA
jgi:hypothetical protein